MFDRIHHQNLADRIKGVVGALPPPATRQRALKAISRFEGLDWNPYAFQRAVDEAAPGALTLDADNHLIYTGDDPLNDVIDILVRYGQLVETRTLFSTAEAATYLGLTEIGMKKKVFKKDAPPDIRGEMVGNSLVFQRAELDRYYQNRRSVGRPRAQPADPTGK